MKTTANHRSLSFFSLCVGTVFVACASPMPADVRVSDAVSTDSRGDGNTQGSDVPSAVDTGVLQTDAPSPDAVDPVDVPSVSDSGVENMDASMDVLDPVDVPAGMDVPNRDVPNGLDVPNVRDVPNVDVPNVDVLGDGGCVPGTADCDRNPANGCEARLDSLQNCGVCGRACTMRANATATCDLAACRYACTRGFEDCDGAPGNGCEANLSSPRSCGRCGNVCGGATPICNGATGTCVGMCPAGTSNCNGSCLNTQSDRNNCGMCGRSCDVANASTTCNMGMCQLTSCNAGFGNCDGQFATGCEADLNTSATNCGMCNSLCTGNAGQFAMCNMGMCNRTCAMGRGNCDMNVNNGCETNIDTSVQHCGACGMACSPAHAVAQCNNGRCAIGACNVGFGDCNRMVADGCESPLNTVAHCGTCGNACSVPNATAACLAGGICGIGMCTMGFGNCDGLQANGCETNLTTNSNNCGACGMRCRAGTTCMMGACR